MDMNPKRPSEVLSQMHYRVQASLSALQIYYLCYSFVRVGTFRKELHSCTHSQEQRPKPTSDTHGFGIEAEAFVEPLLLHRSTRDSVLEDEKRACPTIANGKRARELQDILADWLSELHSHFREDSWTTIAVLLLKNLRAKYAPEQDAFDSRQCSLFLGIHKAALKISKCAACEVPPHQAKYVSMKT
eukprot:IDg16626t1